jgi:hypothetical protein
VATGPTDPSPSPPASFPNPPGPNASRDEWRDWRRQQKEYVRGQMRQSGWYGPTPGWGWWGGGWTWFWGIALVVIGAYYLLQNLGLLSWLKGDILWPVLLIAFGIFLLIRRERGWWW